MSHFSSATAEELFSVFPQWREFARNEKADDGSTYLVVEVSPPPEAEVEHGLIIETSNNEITVGFDCYHSHFNEWVGDDSEHFGTQAALEFIKQIVSERVAVVSWWFNEQWCGSAQLEVGCAPEAPSWANPETYNHVRIRSWHGALNADISA